MQKLRLKRAYTTASGRSKAPTSLPLQEGLRSLPFNSSQHSPPLYCRATTPPFDFNTDFFLQSLTLAYRTSRISWITPGKRLKMVGHSRCRGARVFLIVALCRWPRQAPCPGRHGGLQVCFLSPEFGSRAHNVTFICNGAVTNLCRLPPSAGIDDDVAY